MIKNLSREREVFVMQEVIIKSEKVRSKPFCNGDGVAEF